MRDCLYSARDIRNKMVEMKTIVPGIDVGVSPATNREAEKETKHRHPWHNMLRNVTKKYTDLKFEDCQERTDQESKDCKKQLDDLTSKETIEPDKPRIPLMQSSKMLSIWAQTRVEQR